jgi:BirA family biotin operon repressor/biotin-[acetyl-CoA-carboxylase] ligase
VSYRLHYSEVESTQKVAIALAKEGAISGLAVVSATQVSGLGRGGHSWFSPPGGLYLSVVLHPDPMGLHLLSLAAGLEILSEIAEYTGADLKLKWPNDVVVESDSPSGYRKLCGVLTDVVNPAGILPVAVVGIGLNVKRAHFPPEFADRAVFLEELATREVSPELLEDPVFGAVVRAAERVSSADERAEIGQELNQVLWGVGRRVSIDGVPGVLRGVGPAGEAILTTDNGQESFWTGELSTPRP